MQSNRLIGGILLIIGTCVGAGMLALPVISAASGYHTSIVLLLVCWLFSYFSGLLVLEVNLWLQGEPSYISMARLTLGRPGEVITWVSFLLLFYSLLAAYLAGGGSLLLDALHIIFNTEFQSWVGSGLCMLLFGFITFLGVRAVDYINRVFMVGLIATFAGLIAIAFPHIEVKLLNGGDSKYLFMALPVLLTSFGFHIVIPSLRHYLQSDVKRLKQTILWGSFFTLAIYIMWETVVFGVIPLTGDKGLIAILSSGNTVSGLTDSLTAIINNSWIGNIARFFAFFALTTSFLGVAYGLFDLLADGLKIAKNNQGRLFTALFTFIPPLIYALFYPKGFVTALGYAGAFVAILHGILPIIMAWVGRYRSHARGDVIVYKAPGGILFLILALLFFGLIVYADVANNLNLLPSISH